MRREAGFTILELLMTMIIMGVVLTGVADMFTTALSQFKQQSRIAETNIEGIIGLELLRQDLENAGFGLPWHIATTLTYAEAESSSTTPDATSFNDASKAPRAFVSDSGHGAFGSDVLVIKATNIARSDASQRWSYVTTVTHTWPSAGDNFADTDSVVVIEPGTKDENRRTLKAASASTNGWVATWADAADFAPSQGYNLIYGLDDASPARMPFNRADYFISTTNVPLRCAANAGVLMKSVINRSDGERGDFMPLLDCVADLQVLFRLDRDADGVIESTTDVLTDPLGTDLSAEQIRAQVKEVRVYILAQEGTKDRDYHHSPTTIKVGEYNITHDVDVSAYVNYRWKQYTLVIKPKNLL